VRTSLSSAVPVPTDLGVTSLTATSGPPINASRFVLWEASTTTMSDKKVPPYSNPGAEKRTSKAW
jgi:hypothetical protein